ncbi:MAG: ribosome rescue protein RqcH [Candidatus Thermoplasmatota archaeon]|jgi:predicted ribosome quality control (RQC) complex YloA/Tae2 family protein|nr:ribosome rescue protein RqcH [Candidatus Thermoplasmatota archaeon]
MKRKLSSFDIYVIINELQELVGCYIDKIYQPTHYELIIRVSNSKTKQKENLFIRNGELICLTQKQIDAPVKPTNFSMVLRKHLLNGRISEITQHGFDRIIKLGTSKKEGNYLLVLEFFSDGNIILVDPDGKIVAPLTSQRWSIRTIKTHEKYMPPPEQVNPFDLTFEEFTEILSKSKVDLVRTLAVNVNLSGRYAEEVCRRADVDKNIKIKDLDEKDVKRIFAVLKKFLDLFRNKEFKPVLVKKDDEVVDVLPFEFKDYFDYSFEKIDSFARALDVFIDFEKEEKHEVSVKDKKIERLQRQLVQQQGSVVELEKKMNERKFEGDLIYLNFQQIDALLNEITEVLSHKDKDEGVERINRNEFVKNFDPLSNELVVLLKDKDGKSHEVSLDFRVNVAENANRKYDESKRLKDKLVGALESIEKTKEMIEFVEKQSFHEEKKRTRESGKRFWFEDFRWFISSDGNVVVGGRDAVSNDKVVKKYLREGDRYAHADVHGAPSCVIKSRNVNDELVPISDKTLEEACLFASVYSRAWKQFAEAQAYWVNPEQVSKTPESGEFLPRGAFVIRGKRNYCRCKLVMAVGVVKINGIRKVMGGPVDAVKKLSDKYVVLSPGDIKKSVVANRLARVFDVSTDVVDRVLPPGDLNVVETVGFRFDQGEI